MTQQDIKEPLANTDSLAKTMDEITLQYAQASGHLYGVLIAIALYNDVSVSQFKIIHSALMRANELMNRPMSEFDRERLHERANELELNYLNLYTV